MLHAFVDKELGHIVLVTYSRVVPPFAEQLTSWFQ